jgi:hypothetical protein
MGQARKAFSMLDPTGLRPTGIVVGVILALFFGAQLVNALIPTPVTVPGNGPGSGPISNPGGQPNQPNQPGPTLPPINLPTPGPIANPGNPGGQPGQPGGQVVTAGPLRITLLQGWQVVQPANNAIASFVKGSAQIDLVNLTITGGSATATGLYNGYMGIISQGPTGFTSAPPASIQVGAGTPAARGGYTGLFGSNQVEGDVTAFITGTSDGWVWDAWGTSGTLGPMLGEARQMIDTVQVQ